MHEVSRLDSATTLAQFVSDWHERVKPLNIRMGQWFIINFIANEDNGIGSELWDMNYEDSLRRIRQFIYDNQWDEYALIPLKINENALP